MKSSKSSIKRITFENEFEKKVLDTIENYGLFTKKDRLLVACSGGKDSVTILYLLKKHGYDVEAMTIDVLIGNYTKKNLQNLRAFCREQCIKLHEVSFRERFGKSLCYIKSVLKSKGVNLKSCTVCGVLRRYLLNREARKIRPDYIITGHNMDDEAEAIVMNLLRNNLEVSARLGPKTGLVQDERFIPRVKPLYHCSEKDIVRYSKLKRFNVNYGPCPCRADAYRKEVSDELDRLERITPQLKQNIISSFIRSLQKLKDSYSTGEKIACCSLCGEPSRGEVCNACSIISKIR